MVRIYNSIRTPLKPFITNAIEWFADEFDLDFVIHVKGFRKNKHRKEFFGDCCMRDLFIEIRLSDYHKDAEIIQGLFHELVHARQYLEGRLGRTYPWTWEGSKKHRKTKYKKQPWEIEAYSEESILFDRWLES